MWKRIGLACLGLVAVLAVGFWYFGAQQSVRDTRAKDSTGAETERSRYGVRTGVARTGPEFPMQSRVGSRHFYDVHLTSSNDVSGQDDAGGFTLEAESSLELTVVKQDGASVFVQGELDAARVDVQSTHGAVPTEEIKAQLSRPFMFEQDREGRVTSVHLARDLNAVAHGIVRQIVAGLQFIRPAGVAADAERWTVRETDANGVCTAEYVRQQDRRIRKTKTGCRPDSDGRTFKVATQRDWVGHYRLAPDSDVIREVVVDERTQAGLGIATLSGHGTLSLRWVGADRAAGQPGLLATLASAPLHRSAPLPERRREPLDPELTVDQLVSDLRSLPEEADPRQWAAVTDVLARLVAERPAAIADVLDALKHDSGLGLTARTELVAALAEADTPEAQRALLDIARDAALEPPDLRQTATMRLGLSDDPTEETVEGLSELARSSEGEGKSTAALMLGSAARRAAEGVDEAQRAVADQAVDQLVESLQNADDPQEAALYLEALGNSHDPAVFEHTRDALESESTQVRASALSALRNLEGAEVDAVIGEMARNDPASDVRLKAVDVLRQRPATEASRDTLGAIIKQDEDEFVRGQALEVIAAQGPPEVSKPLLEWAAQNDSSEALRKVASELLGDEQG